MENFKQLFTDFSSHPVDRKKVDDLNVSHSISEVNKSPRNLKPTDTEQACVKEFKQSSDGITSTTKHNESSDSNTVVSEEPVPNYVHTASGINGGCYCGKPRDLQQIELQCCVCCKYFHQKCISIETVDMLPFTTNYQFFCITCSTKSTEIFNKRQASFSQLCVSAIANLTLKADPKLEHRGLFFFSKDKDIIPFIELNWDLLTTAPRRVRSTWHSSISKALAKDDDFLMNKEGLYGLRRFDLESIGPVSESLRLLLTPTRSSTESTSKSNATQSEASIARRTSKRKNAEAISLQQKTKKPVDKVIPVCFPTEYPVNKDNYRYHLAEPDPHAPRNAEGDSISLNIKEYPGQLHRMYIERTPMLSISDRGPKLLLSDDRMTVTGHKGYTMVRACHAVSYGTWYYEITITNQPENSCCRFGYSSQLGNLNAPCGYDQFSYSWRARKGTVFHNSCGKHYSNEGYRRNDILGCLIHLPCKDITMMLPKPYKHLPVIKFRNHLYFEEHEDPVLEAENQVPLPGSKIVFYKNGKWQGVAFSDIYKNRYFPAISLYKDITVRVNFGPNFHYFTNVMLDYPSVQPMSFADNAVEHTLADILFHINEILQFSG
ncbi:hypothetical protein GJ496_001824 [Pomphorhynchus laevis]|nr:hypothetical protein GJ496_001824 [Pomphorhynchus laevis]